MAVAARRAHELPGSAPWRRRPPIRPVGRPARRRPAVRRRKLPFVLLSAILVAGLVLMLTSVQALVAQGAFRLSELDRQTERLELRGDQLRLRLARLSSPQRVATAARQAGLVTPERVEILDGR